MAKAKKEKDPLLVARLALARHEGVIGRLVCYLGLDVQPIGSNYSEGRLDAVDKWLTDQEKLELKKDPF